MLLQAVEYDYVSPPELGGRRANFPQVDPTIRNGMFRELLFNWFGPTGVGPSTSVDNPDDERSYDNGLVFEGNVWSIQLSFRPGYYVSPDWLQEYAESDQTWSSYG